MSATKFRFEIASRCRCLQNMKVCALIRGFGIVPDGTGGCGGTQMAVIVKRFIENIS